MRGKICKKTVLRAKSFFAGRDIIENIGEINVQVQCVCIHPAMRRHLRMHGEPQDTVSVRNDPQSLLCKSRSLARPFHLRG